MYRLRGHASSRWNSRRQNNTIRGCVELRPPVEDDELDKVY